MKHWLMILLITASCGMPAAAGLVAPDGREYTEIVIAADAPGSVRLAAEEFVRHIARATGKAPLPVRADGIGSGNGPAVFIGRSPATVRADIALDSLRDDGFRIVSRPDALYLAGVDNYGPDPVLEINPWRAQEMVNSELELCALGSSGTLYAVYRFLQEYIGYRWVWPGESGTVVPQRSTIAVPEFALEDAPDFAYRYAWFHMAFLAPEQLLWFKRIGLGGSFPVFANHSYNLFTAQYQDTHPEYFALADGERDTGGRCAISGGGHLCLTNPEVVEAFAKLACDYFDQNPAQNVFPAVPMDGLNRVCECPSCQAEVDYDKPVSNRFSNHIFHFANQVAKRVGELRPGKFISCLSYPNHAGIPDRIEKFAPNLMVIVVYSRMKTMYVRGYADTIRAELEAWSRITGQLYTWNHYLEHWNEWQGFPVGTPEMYQDEYRFLQSLGSWKGEFIEAEGQSSLDELAMPGTQHLGLLLSARCMWHPDFDLEAFMLDYYHSFYGPAMAPMRDFWTTAFERFQSMSGKILAHKERMVPEDVFDDTTIARLSEDLREARELVADDSVYARRIGIVSGEFLPMAQRLLRFAEAGDRELAVPSDTDAAVPVRMVGKRGDEALPATWVRVHGDDRNLYCDFYCYTDAAADRPVPVLPRDDYALWERDVIEIFLAPDPEEPQKCFQIAVDFGGNIWDGRYFIGGVRSEDWNAKNLKVATHPEAGRTVVSVTIPFADLEMAHPAGKSVRANFYRNYAPELQQEAASWSPTFTQGHYIPERFGRLKFEKQQDTEE